MLLLVSLVSFVFHSAYTDANILPSVSIPASPTVSVPQQWVVLERESHLKCHAVGFYPPPVSFSWIRDGREIQPPYQVEGEQTADGFYTAEANLTFWPSRDDQNVTFGCKVSHNASNVLADMKLKQQNP
uniref:Ig-like domain-containing protein n=1 Tax=Sphaeramia orbicularis TaxID=375764 RepID=A0A673CVE8_9TELE